MNNFAIKSLVLQGGGALGGYQVGVYKALHENNYLPDIVVGISIGAINASIIVGNAPQNRLDKLNQFWKMITHETYFDHMLTNNAHLSKFHNWYSAFLSASSGQNGFFRPNFYNPWFLQKADPTMLSYYNTKELKNTLLKVIDFDYLNQTDTRLSIGAVDLESGDFTFFDNQEMEITPEHVMASGAMPPGLPAIQINDRYYIDGGVFLNTPMARIFDLFSEQHDVCINNVLCFMVDLFSVSGSKPSSMDGLLERVKDIQYSSRTKRFTALYSKIQELKRAINSIETDLPDNLRNRPEFANVLPYISCPHHMDIVQLTYHSKLGTERHSKDYEFSKTSYLKHFNQGFEDTLSSINRFSDRWTNSTSKNVIDLYNIGELV